MAILLNGGARNLLLNDVIIQCDHLRCYSGAPPAGPEDPATGTLLVDITPIKYGPGYSGTSGTKTLNSNATGVCVASGTIGYARLGASSTSIHMQGSCGIGTSADFILDSLICSSGGTTSLIRFRLIAPSGE